MNYWGHTDEKYIYFMLMPPWIKARVADAYTSLISKEKHTIKTESEDSEDKDGEKAKKLVPKLYSAEIDI